MNNQVSNISIWVSPKDDDARSGQCADPRGGGSDGPFLTIARALQGVREIRTRDKASATKRLCNSNYKHFKLK